MTWYDSARLGLFVHYLYGGAEYYQSVDATGAASADVDALAAAFDVNQFAADAEAFGAEYVVFTAWHYGMYVLYPSTAIDATLTGHSASRDLIADLIAALTARGIRLMLYVHPVIGHTLTEGEQAATGWTDATDDYAAWAAFMTGVLTEMGERYGTTFDGFWVDSVPSPTFGTHVHPNSAAFRTALLAGNPNRVIVGNLAADIQSNTYTPGLIDYCSREYYAGNGRPASIEDWTPSWNQTATLGSSTEWWAIRAASGADAAPYTAAQMARYAVLQAGANLYGGGIMWAAGPYSGSPVSLWEPDVETTFTAAAALLAPLSSSVRNTLPSTSYVTDRAVTLTTLDAFVSVISADRAIEYIHVLNPPVGALSLPSPADWPLVTFTGAVNVASGRTVTLEAGESGALTLTLDAADDWSAVDTAIALTRVTRMRVGNIVTGTGVPLLLEGVA